MSYFDALQRDYDQFAFPVPHFQSIIPRMQPAEVETYDDLHSLMLNISAGVGGADHRSRHLIDADPQSLDLQTKFARHVVAMCRIDRMDRLSSFLCPDAERRLAVSMQPERIANPEKDSPVIVQHAGRAIGIMKQLGERNYFALEDDPVTATYAGHLYRTAIESAYYRPFIKEKRDDPELGSYKMLADHAFSLSIDEVAEHIRPGLRFSIFMIPVKARRKLTSSSTDEIERHADFLALRTSLSFLREVAQHALASAEPAHIGNQCHPKRVPRGWQEIQIDGKYQLVPCEF